MNADDAPPEDRVQARTNDGRALIDTAPRRACQAMRLLGDPRLLNGGSDESVRVEACTGQHPPSRGRQHGERLVETSDPPAYQRIAR